MNVMSLRHTDQTAWSDVFLTKRAQPPTIKGVCSLRRSMSLCSQLNDADGFLPFQRKKNYE